MTYNNQQQSIILKGIAQQILQMNVPTFNEMEILFKGFNVSVNTTEYQFSKEEVKRALLALFIFSGNGNPLDRVKGNTYGEKVDNVLYHATHSMSATQTCSRLIN